MCLTKARSAVEEEKMVTANSQLTHALCQSAYPLTGTATDYDPLLDLVGDARFVLIGEATHGTHEFYEQRAEIKLKSS